MLPAWTCQTFPSEAVPQPLATLRPAKLSWAKTVAPLVVPTVGLGERLGLGEGRRYPRDRRSPGGPEGKRRDGSNQPNKNGGDDVRANEQQEDPKGAPAPVQAHAIARFARRVGNLDRFPVECSPAAGTAACTEVIGDLPKSPNRPMAGRAGAPD